MLCSLGAPTQAPPPPRESRSTARDRGPLRIAAAALAHPLSKLACRVRHWLEPRSLTSERSCADHGSSAMLPCDAMLCAIPAVRSLACRAARSAGRANLKSHASPQRAADRRTQRACTRVLTVLTRAHGSRSTVLCAPQPMPCSAERRGAACDERQAKCSRSACQRLERTSARAPARRANVPHSAPCG